MERLVGNVDLRLEDLHAAYAELPSLKQSRLFAIVLMGSAPLVLVINAAQKGAWLAAGIAASLSPILVGITLGGMALARRLMTRRQFHALPEPERSFHYELDSDGLTVETKASRTRLGYGELHRVAEGPSSFIVFTSTTAAQVIPKRAFSERDAKKVSERFADKVKPDTRAEFRRAVFLFAALILMFLVVWTLLRR